VRRVTERLEGYAFAVAHQPADGTESPGVVTEELVFLDNPQNPLHTVVIPLTAAGKQALIAQLTGGLIVASASG
jgi:hypothetical protein